MLGGSWKLLQRCSASAGMVGEVAESELCPPAADAAHRALDVSDLGVAREPCVTSDSEHDEDNGDKKAQRS